jgi:uncharacterized protein YdhG (YjbR/CyaY superfamily)
MAQVDNEATKKAAGSTTAKGKSSAGFTDEEKAAMKSRVRELKEAKADGENVLLAAIAALPDPDRAMGERIHAIVKANAPSLSPTTWYGQPAYAKGSNVVCFFQPAKKFKTRYATLGFSDKAKLDDGTMWPTSYALKELTAASEAKIGELVKKAAG